MPAPQKEGKETCKKPGFRGTIHTAEEKNVGAGLKSLKKKKKKI